MRFSILALFDNKTFTSRSFYIIISMRLKHKEVNCAMNYFFSKISRIIAIVFAVLLEIANMFIGNIIQFSDGFSFDWNKLLHSPFFWIVIIISVVYHSIPFVTRQDEKETDEALDKAFSQTEVSILKSIPTVFREKDFESLDKAIDVLDDLQNRRDRL